MLKRPNIMVAMVALMPQLALTGTANAQSRPATAARPDVPLRLWYDTPAPDDNDGWVSRSLPLGNGYMGVNVFGGVATERLQITENSLVDSPDKKIGGLNSFADLFLEFPHSAPTHYSRDLVLNDAMANVAYDNGGVRYTRAYFVSYPDKVLVIRLKASKAGTLDFTLRPRIPYLADYRKVPGDHRGKRGTVFAASDTVSLRGMMDYYGIRFEGRFKVIPQNGTITATNDAGKDNGAISVHGADSAVILVAVATNYQVGNPQIFSVADRLEKLKGLPDPHQKVVDAIAAAAARPYTELLRRHEADYSSLFARVNFDLGASTPAIPTDQVIDAERAGRASPYLDQLAFQFGRYLLISSSRKGALPPNLQGVWNVYQDPPWSSGYWHNVNQQMNYWLAFNTNLPELFDSYIDFYRAYLPAHRARATEYLTKYHPAGLAADGDNGWALGNSMRPFEISAKVPHSGFGTGPWTTMLFWDAYDFTRDKTLLRQTVYPAMRGQANFLSRFVQDIGGKLLAKPSSSPENANNLQSAGTTFDQQMIYENYRDTIAAAGILGIDDPLTATLKAQMPRLDPILIGDSGQIKEYREETSYGSIGDPLHRHTSQLLGLFPGRLINAETPAWLDAARVSLEKRGPNGTTGWSQAERLATWARLGDGEQAYAFYRYWLSHYAMYNLWNNHRDSRTSRLFQIDGNFGVTAGVGEMLLQSQGGIVTPLPALPREWPSGSYRGLLARGAFEVSAQWSNGHADRIAILSRAGAPLTLRYPGVAGATVRTDKGDPVHVDRKDRGDIAFDTVAGRSYVITNIPTEPTVAPVAGLTADIQPDGTVRLQWQAGDPRLSCSIYRAEDDSPVYQRVATSVRGLAYLDKGAEAAAAKLRYRIVASSPSGAASAPVDVFLLRARNSR